MYSQHWYSQQNYSSRNRSLQANLLKRYNKTHADKIIDTVHVTGVKLITTKRGQQPMVQFVLCGIHVNNE